ncbi:hypothetical protein B0H13DRAFT_2109164 [Mycena leptocephala]|nr:hypothetical protein B0H13DRAFT_2109164 [Mycena leptocephala]
MAQLKPQEREQNDAVREQRDVAGAFEVQLRRRHQLGTHHRRREALRGSGGMGEREERGEGIVHSLQRERKVRAQEREEEGRWECKEPGEEQGRGGVDGSAEPDAQILDFGDQGLGPEDKGGFRSGWRGDGGWKDRRIGAAVCVIVRGQRS